MIHKSVCDSVGNFDEALPACEDYDLWLRIAARFEVNYIEQACINKYGGHEDQLSRQYWGMDRFRVIALEKILNLDSADPALATDMRLAAIDMLTKKLNILYNGAIKHGNTELSDYCVAALQRWANA